MRNLFPLKLAARGVENTHLIATAAVYWGHLVVPAFLEHFLEYSVVIPIFTLTMFTIIPLTCWAGERLCSVIIGIGNLGVRGFALFARLPDWVAGKLILLRKTTGKAVISLGRAMMRNGPETA